MSIVNDFTDIKIKNPDNKYIVDEFIRYFDWIYSNYTKSAKSSKENYYKLLVIKKTIEIISKFSKTIISGSDLANIKGIGPKSLELLNRLLALNLDDLKKYINSTNQKNGMVNKYDK